VRAPATSRTPRASPRVAPAPRRLRANRQMPRGDALVAWAVRASPMTRVATSGAPRRGRPTLNHPARRARVSVRIRVAPRIHALMMSWPATQDLLRQIQARHQVLTPQRIRCRCRANPSRDRLHQELLSMALDSPRRTTLRCNHGGSHGCKKV